MGIFLVVFRINVQQYAQIGLLLHIALELAVELRSGGFLSDFNVLRAVIADNASPKSIVEIKNQRLFVPSVNRAYDIGKIISKLRNGRNRQRILVHMPVIGICPFCQTVAGSEIVDILNEEIVMGLRIAVKQIIQPCYKVQLSVGIGDILISEQAVKGLFKIVLNHRTVKRCRDFIPHLFIGAIGGKKHGLDVVLTAANGRKFMDVPGGGVDINQIRCEGNKLRIIKHHILPVLRIFGLIKNGCNSLVQKEKLQNFFDVIGCGAAENCYFLGDT